jgi:hypothetical protein
MSIVFEVVLKMKPIAVSTKETACWFAIVEKPEPLVALFPTTRHF